ncbi:unnamed protein product [Calicophoron daubneyi]|uniref:Large ribosomal subunit protein mL50 n=1 Tax=Calicophoron daubneyi TaxID=300641 RepID=A0AAV2TMF5_CALDB
MLKGSLKTQYYVYKAAVRLSSTDSHFSSRLQSLADSSQRDVIMKTKPYNPPEDTESRIKQLAIRIVQAPPSNPSGYTFKSNAEKYKLFTACAKEFDHPVLNSFLHELGSVDALIQYYLTPVCSPDVLQTLTDECSRDQLPPNLHIQTEPLRYNPATDTFFGCTAYPGRSTVVSSLAALRKHKGFRAPKTRRIRVEYDDRA